LGFFVVITSVMEQSFRVYFMTPFHTENLTGSQRQFVFGHAEPLIDGLSDLVGCVIDQNHDIVLGDPPLIVDLVGQHDDVRP
jgi:hypothetical protein